MGVKKIGILHNELAQVVASMGHGDQLVIGDAGLPVPQGVPCIDLAVTFGTPTLQTVLDTVLAELCVERVTLAVQTEHANAALWQSVRQYADAENWAVDVCSHDEFKQRTRNACAVVRTGDNTPYTNIILHSGVPF